MSARIIDGKAIARKVEDEVRADVAQLFAQRNVTPCLAVLLVGEDPASQVYVRNKIQKAKETGIRSLEYRLSATTSEADVLARIDALNRDVDVHGILVQLPLPAQIDERSVIEAIRPDKDVDGFHPLNVGALQQGLPALVACTPLGCLRLLQEALEGQLAGKHAVIVGRSNIVGKPMAALLLQADCAVTVVHSKVANAAEIARSADIVVAAVGKPRLVGANWIRPGATVIDVGINRVEEAGKSRLVGDVDFERVQPIAAAITPVPGGVGPMTIACLMQNTARAAERATRIRSLKRCTLNPASPTRADENERPAGGDGSAA
ncbi:MAG: bifunctional methylenetetrahydrofolate dehydrogenase/methenyltetrahydrofolate cyclohydrolase FolD [Burkholderiaceae bacterium]|jgi:methylenetetrahydrofolate dehydrogenase (NADP+)/methenyltetrahydrofolate cyclohydrolase|nr:bifunctional methylenetetrahydrofolate dehydrogenase/methenyltetrahydrofolate cyclohydrolase FolD [Burkholderiaceae bacterium]